MTKLYLFLHQFEHYSKKLLRLYILKIIFHFLFLEKFLHFVKPKRSSFLFDFSLHKLLKNKKKFVIAHHYVFCRGTFFIISHKFAPKFFLFSFFQALKFPFQHLRTNLLKDRIFVTKVLINSVFSSFIFEIQRKS